MRFCRIVSDVSNCIEQREYSLSFGALRIQIFIVKHKVNKCIQVSALDSYLMLNY